MKYFAVSYQYRPDNPVIAEQRPAHREFIGQLNERGHILGSGPFTDSVGGALIVVQSEAEDFDVPQVMELMDADPFYTSGAVTARDIRAWNPVINSFS